MLQRKTRENYQNLPEEERNKKCEYGAFDCMFLSCHVRVSE